MSIFSKRGQTAPAEPKLELHPDVKAVFEKILEALVSQAAAQIGLQGQIDQLKKGALAQQEMISSISAVVIDGIK
jgi:hypothetical protein